MKRRRTRKADEEFPRPRTWIFQANPERYRILESLRHESAERWNLNQHAADVEPGDRVLIWLCGANAGVYAVGTVVTEPIVAPDSPTGQTYWREPGAGQRPKPRVTVRYDRKLLDRPLRKAYLEADPTLASLSILRSPQGTNFVVTEQEWLAIRQWLDDDDSDGVPVDGQ